MWLYCFSGIKLIYGGSCYGILGVIVELNPYPGDLVIQPWRNPYNLGFQTNSYIYKYGGYSYHPQWHRTGLYGHIFLFILKLRLDYFWGYVVCVIFIFVSFMLYSCVSVRIWFDSEMCLFWDIFMGVITDLSLNGKCEWLAMYDRNNEPQRQR